MILRETIRLSRRSRFFNAKIVTGSLSQDSLVVKLTEWLLDV